MHKRIQDLLSTTLIVFGLAATPVLAQDTATTGTPTPEQSTATRSYSDTQLQNFISASRQVALISQEYAPQIESTTSPNEREQVFREADDKMVAAVESEGLSVNEFNAINQQLPHDAALEQRVSDLLQESQ